MTRGTRGKGLLMLLIVIKFIACYYFTQTITSYFTHSFPACPCLPQLSVTIKTIILTQCK